MSLRSSLLLALVLFVLSPSVLPAQREYNVWCFGAGAGLDFNGGSAVPITSALNTLEGTASIADPLTGALLFYTDGETVYNASGVAMPNGRGLYGSINSSQSALIIAAPGDLGRYYLFTADAGPYDATPAHGLHYSVVDMTLDGGRGDVTLRNVPLLAVASEKLTAAPMRSGCGYWVVAHGWGDDRFHVWRLTTGGVGAPAVMGQGGVHADEPGRTPGSSTIGSMKFSPDGSALASALFGQGRVELFSFDDASGAVRFRYAVPVCDQPYGISFSADGRLLYVSCQLTGLWVMDATAPDSAAAAASLRLLSDTTAPGATERYGALQLAPDGRIYHNRSGGRWLGAITGGVYEPFAIDLGRDPRMGLPNLIEAYFSRGSLACNAPVADFIPGDTTICAGACIDFIDRSRNDPLTWRWTFAGALVDSSAERNPRGICFPAPGRYAVTLTVANGFGAARRTAVLTVLPRGELSASMSRDAVLRPGDTAELLLRLDAPIDSLRLGSVRLGFRYDATVLRLVGLDASAGLLAGWRLDSQRVDHRSGLAMVAFTAPPGATLSGTGEMARLRFATFLGRADSSNVAFELASDANPCLGSTSLPGLVRLEGCGLPERLVELGPATYALLPNRPNPFNPATTIPFSVGLDGYVRLTISDASGRMVAVPVDSYLRAGHYRISWDAAAHPSGVYYYTVISGEWNATGRMVLER